MCDDLPGVRMYGTPDLTVLLLHTPPVCVDVEIDRAELAIETKNQLALLKVLETVSVTSTVTIEHPGVVRLNTS